MIKVLSIVKEASKILLIVLISSSTASLRPDLVLGHCLTEIVFISLEDIPGKEVPILMIYFNIKCLRNNGMKLDNNQRKVIQWVKIIHWLVQFLKQEQITLLLDIKTDFISTVVEMKYKYLRISMNTQSSRINGNKFYIIQTLIVIK